MTLRCSDESRRRNSWSITVAITAAKCVSSNLNGSITEVEITGYDEVSKILAFDIVQGPARPWTMWYICVRLIGCHKVSIFLKYSSTRDLESQKIIPRIAWTKTRLTKSLVIQGWTLVIIQKWSNRRSGTTYALITWKYVKAGIISPGTWAWTSIIISCITAAWCWTSIVGLKDFVELPLTHELIPVGIVCCRYSSKCFYSYWKENGIFCGINKNDPAIHHADISKASHNDPCYNTCLIVISIQYITLDASTSTMTIVATRIASSILLTKEGIR